MQIDKRFPKAKLVKFSISPPIRIKGELKLRPLYARMSNASTLYVPFLWLQITWRMPWLPNAAYAMGWDAAWRQCNGIEA